MNVTRRFRNYFLRGLAVLLPTMLTLWILAWGCGLIQRNISVHINKGIEEAVRFIISSGGVAAPDGWLVALPTTPLEQEKC